MRIRIRLAGALLLALAFSGSILSADAMARGLTPWDVAKLQSVTSVAVSPDGDFIAYTVSVPREVMVDDNGPNWSELHVYEVATAESRPFITGEVSVSGVSWTPDGSHIAFLSKRNGEEKTALYVIGAKGGEARKLVAHTESIAKYDFNDAATRVAFLSKQGETEREEELHEQGFDMEAYEENIKNNELYLAEIDLMDFRASADDTARTIEVEGHVDDLHYRPGHEQVLVSLTADSRIDLHYMFRHYALVDLASGDVIGRIDTEGKLGAASFSPNGEQLAFIGAAGINDPAAGRVMVASATGGAATDLVPGLLGHAKRIAWKNDGTVLYLADMNVRTELVEVSANGGAPKVLLQQGQPVMLNMSIAKNGKMMAFTGESFAYPSELFIGRLGKTPKRVSNVNPWLAEIELGDQVVHEWTARDGMELEGILVQPVGYEHGRRYPLIVQVHGGPEAHERNGWKTWYSRPGQYMAAQGYFVWYPNYRGSTGRGVEFSLTSQGDPGGAEFDDVVDGVNDLIDSGLVERGKVGITGGSYGGYATAWGATKLSEHYQAAVMFVGISEQIAKFGTTDIPRESQLVHQYPRKVYDDWDFFRERSPIFHADGSKTPLLILHGKNDPRVHPTQSMIMYRYFEMTADAPVRLVWYPGEGHGNRKAAGKLDYSLRLMRWMNHFLLEGGSEKPDFEIDYEEMEEVMVGK